MEPLCISKQERADTVVIFNGGSLLLLIMIALALVYWLGGRKK